MGIPVIDGCVANLVARGLPSLVIVLDPVTVKVEGKGIVQGPFVFLGLPKGILEFVFYMSVFAFLCGNPAYIVYGNTERGRIFKDGTFGDLPGLGIIFFTGIGIGKIS